MLATRATLGLEAGADNDREYTRDNACHEVFVYYAFNAFPMIATIY